MNICITGKAGSGKTTAIKILQEHNFCVFVMDDYIHDIYQFNQIGYNLIKKHFGDQYVNELAVDRKKLGQLVFNDQSKLDLLNQIMIPIMQKKLAELQSKKEPVFIELAIYINHENKFKNFFDKIVLITTEKELENNNLFKKFNYLRNFSTNGVDNLKNPIQSNQIRVDYFVDNTKDKNYLKKQILKIANQL